jgi:hypothetical protein
MTHKVCVHYWFIDSSGRGKCRHCGTIRIYWNESELSKKELQEMRRQADAEVKAARAGK